MRRQGGNLPGTANSIQVSTTSNLKTIADRKYAVVVMVV